MSAPGECGKAELSATATRTQGQRFGNAGRLRRHTTGGRWAAYEAAKAAWDQANAGADYRARDAAMRQLAKSLGV